MSDFIESLPIDENPISKEDTQLVMELFGNEQTNKLQSLVTELYYPFIIGGVFLLCNIKTIDTFLHTLIPYTRSSNMFFLLLKTLVFSSIVYIILNR